MNSSMYFLFQWINKYKKQEANFVQLWRLFNIHSCNAPKYLAARGSLSPCLGCFFFVFARFIYYKRDLFSLCVYVFVCVLPLCSYLAVSILYSV